MQIHVYLVVSKQKRNKMYKVIIGVVCAFFASISYNDYMFAKKYKQIPAYSFEEFMAIDQGRQPLYVTLTDFCLTPNGFMFMNTLKCDRFNKPITLYFGIQDCNFDLGKVRVADDTEEMKTECSCFSQNGVEYISKFTKIKGKVSINNGEITIHRGKEPWNLIIASLIFIASLLGVLFILISYLKHIKEFLNGRDSIEKKMKIVIVALFALGLLGLVFLYISQ